MLARSKELMKSGTLGGGPDESFTMTEGDIPSDALKSDSDNEDDFNPFSNMSEERKE